jgi:anaerobic selenocysteine-containing dehydrogenase
MNTLVDNITTFHGGCPQDCPDTCAMTYTVKDGKLIDVQGKPEHPMTRGGLCVKVKDFPRHHQNPERVLYPLKRTGPKGSREFTRISWDEALQEIKTRWTSIIDEYGAQAIMPYSYLGNQGIVQGLNVGDPFFNKLGATVCERTFCGSGSSTAWLMTMGPTGGLDPESFAYSKYIVIWGCNSVSTNLHHWHIIHEAQKKGVKLVVIDTYKSLTAKLADWHIMPKPGTDGALAMALINTLIKQDLLDHDYIANHTLGFEELKERARDCTPEWAETICGVPAADIRKLAKEMFDAKATAIRMGVALERHHGGGQTIRAVCCISGLMGSWRYVGGGTMQFPLWEFPINFGVVCRPDYIKPGTRVINNLRLGQALNGEMPLDPPLKSVMFYNANPVSQAPESNKIVEGLKRDDLFVVVAEHFITDTASYADIILPATMAAEMDDMILSWGHFYLTYNQKAVEPPGETASNAEIFRRLAKTFGFDEPQFQRSDAEMVWDTLAWDSPALAGVTREDFQRDGYVHLKVGEPSTRTPHKEGNFPTPSGKLEFKSSAAAGGNFVAPPFRQCYEAFQGAEPVDPLPSYVPCRERPETNPELAMRYPLNIVTPKSHAFLNSQYANEESKVRAQGEQYVLIHPADATARGIRDGDFVRVFNDRGEFHGDARVSDDTQPGVVVATLGYWRSRNRGGGAVNVISSDQFVNMGHAPSLSDNLVQVEAATA